MLGKVNLNTLMNIFSGPGAGGGLGVPNAPNGQYANIYRVIPLMIFFFLFVFQPISFH
jgi:hypothetical protein